MNIHPLPISSRTCKDYLNPMQIIVHITIFIKMQYPANYPMHNIIK
jgi:hypothetical protein